MTEITSATNPRYRTWLSLLGSKGIKANQLALISGKKLVEEQLELAGDDVPVELLLPPKVAVPVTRRSVRVFQLTASLFKALDEMGTHSPIMVRPLPDVPSFIPGTDPQGLELVLPLSDPQNLGATLRSAEAFGANRIILTEEAANPFLPKAVRSSGGAVFRLKLFSSGPLTHPGLNGGYALDMIGQSVSTFSWPKNMRLILGEEGRGLPQELTAEKLAIPMNAGPQSLNAMAAASIALFCYWDKNGAGILVNNG